MVGLIDEYYCYCRVLPHGLARLCAFVCGAVMVVHGGRVEIGMKCVEGMQGKNKY